MRLTLLAALAASAATLPATPVFYEFQDAYGGPNPGSAVSNGDVIGRLRSFDIDRITLRGDGDGQFHFTVFMNYGQDGGDVSLSGINVGGGFPILHPGDLMFTSGSNHWAISLIDHGSAAPGAGGLQAGDLYRVNGFLTAGQILGNAPGTFRPQAYVWGDPTGSSRVGEGAVQASGDSGSRIRVDIGFQTSDLAFLHAMSIGDFQVMFAAATCGNDIILGDGGSGVPEPLTSGLIGAGLAVLGLLRRGRD